MGSIVFVIHRAAKQVLAAGMRTVVAGTQVWGGITGLLSDQSDLQAALDSMNAGLNSKVDKSGTKVLSDENYTEDEKAKLAGIAANATANATDAHLLERANHTGSQSASTISDLAEVTQDMVGAMIVAGAGVSVAYDDTAGTLTISASGGGGGGTAVVIDEPSTSRTLALSDAGAYIRWSQDGGLQKTCTLPPHGLVAWADNTEIHGRNAFYSNLVLNGGSGVQIFLPYLGTKVIPPGGSFTLKRVALDQWDLIGQTVPA